jgi:hypothetical protein
VIQERITTGGDILLLAPVRGLATEAQDLPSRLDSFAPEAVGVGVSAEELKALVEYFVLPEAEPLVPLTPSEVNEVRGLVRFGEVRVPNPATLEALRWGRAHAVLVAPLDPDEASSAEMFREHIGYVELVRRTVRERRLGREPPAPSSPDDFAVEWERGISKGRGSRRLAQARDAYLASELERLAAGRRRVAVVVDRERFEGIKTVLAGARPGPASDRLR